MWQCHYIDGVDVVVSVPILTYQSSLRQDASCKLIPEGASALRRSGGSRFDCLGFCLCLCLSVCVCVCVYVSGGAKRVPRPQLLKLNASP